jgi:hypothetical protein
MKDGVLQTAEMQANPSDDLLRTKCTMVQGLEASQN